MVDGLHNSETWIPHRSLSGRALGQSKQAWIEEKAAGADPDQVANQLRCIFRRGRRVSARVVVAEDESWAVAAFVIYMQG